MGDDVISRAAVVKFLRAEADGARHAQANAAIDHPDKLYRMGQKDGLLIVAEAIEREFRTADFDGRAHMFLEYRSIAALTSQPS